MGENVAVATGCPAAAGTAAAAGLLLEMLLHGLDCGHLLLATAAAGRLLDRHHLVGLGLVGRP
jgi:hypothetical protein